MIKVINDIKIALRIKNDALDTEVQDLIDSSKADLILSGVLESKVEGTDSLIKRAIILYCKSHFGLDNADSEKYMASYTSLKIHLTLSQEYTVSGVV